MKDWKERFEDKFVVERMQPQNNPPGWYTTPGYYLSLKENIKYEEIVDFIDQIISERDKEWQTWIERFKKLKGCPCMCDRCKNKLINGFK